MAEECELCGKPMQEVYVVDIEGVEMRTCASCAKGNKAKRVEGLSQKGKVPAWKQYKKPPTEEEMELIDNYGEAIRKARESMRLPITVLAELINEKEHLILRVEEERTMPSIALTKKLEKALKIKITEPPVGNSGPPKASSSRDVTIGDFIDKPGN